MTKTIEKVRYIVEVQDGQDFMTELLTWKRIDYARIIRDRIIARGIKASILKETTFTTLEEVE